MKGNKRRKKKYVITYINKNNAQRQNYVKAYSENEAVTLFLKYAEKSTIVSVDEE